MFVSSWGSTILEYEFNNSSRGTRCSLPISLALHALALLLALSVSLKPPGAQLFPPAMSESEELALDKRQKQTISQLAELEAAVQQLRLLRGNSGSTRPIRAATSVTGLSPAAVLERARFLEQQLLEEYSKHAQHKEWASSDKMKAPQEAPSLQLLVERRRVQVQHVLAQKQAAGPETEPSSATTPQHRKNGGSQGAHGESTGRGMSATGAMQQGSHGNGAQGEATSLVTGERAILSQVHFFDAVPGLVFLGPVQKVSWSFLDSWYTIGPFSNSTELRNKRYPPELHLDLDAVYQGLGGAPVHWRYQRSITARVVPITEQENSVHYAYTELRSDRERQVWFVLGADDSMKVWLNGELIWDCDGHLRQWRIDEGARPATLVKGYNSLLVRLSNSPGEGEFSVVVRLAP